MFLHDVIKPKGSHKRKKIVGRGQGSGHGKTSCRGNKGQKSRAGRAIIHGLEGGQMPLIRRLPKVGFRRRHPTVYEVVNLEQLTRFKEGSEINAEFLKSHGLIRSATSHVKILGDGELKKPLNIQVHAFSKNAQDKIVKAGGKAEVIKS